MRAQTQTQMPRPSLLFLVIVVTHTIIPIAITHIITIIRSGVHLLQVASPNSKQQLDQ
jgi:hypothetical protein